MHPNTEVHLYLIRHAESRINMFPHLIGGRSQNSPLSPNGESQCDDLAEYLLDENINIYRAYSSPILRSVLTAKKSLDDNDHKQLILDDRLVEYSAGEWEGKKRHEVHTPDVLRQMSLMGIDFCPPGGESQRQVIMRVAAWLQDAILGNHEILQSGRILPIAVFSHGLTIKCLLHHILGFDSPLIWRMEIDNCSLSKLVYNAGGWWPKYINRIP